MVALFSLLCILTYSLMSHLFYFHLFIHLFSFLTCCLRCDITAVLLYVEDLMWSVCENPKALAHCSPYSAIAIIAGGSDWPYQIHSLCEQLLTVLIIVTAPLSLLHRLVPWPWKKLNFSISHVKLNNRVCCIAIDRLLCNPGICIQWHCSGLPPILPINLSWYCSK